MFELLLLVAVAYTGFCQLLPATPSAVAEEDHAKPEDLDPGERREHHVGNRVARGTESVQRRRGEGRLSPHRHGRGDGISVCGRGEGLPGGFGRGAAPGRRRPF